MKILFTIRSLTGGGAERVVSVLSGLLADVGEDVHIITYKRQRETILFQKRYRYMKCHNERIVQ